MSFHVPNDYRIRTHPRLGSDDSYGNNGAFSIRSVRAPRVLNVIASDGLGWEHVSVSVDGNPNECPTWGDMCKVKSLFWDPDDCVIQFHPPESKYVNCHPGTLHLWRSTDFEFPVPDPALVGPRR